MKIIIVGLCAIAMLQGAVIYAGQRQVTRAMIAQHHINQMTLEWLRDLDDARPRTDARPLGMTRRDI